MQNISAKNAMITTTIARPHTHTLQNMPSAIGAIYSLCCSISRMGFIVRCIAMLFCGATLLSASPNPAPTHDTTQTESTPLESTLLESASLESTQGAESSTQEVSHTSATPYSSSTTNTHHTSNASRKHHSFMLGGSLLSGDGVLLDTLDTQNPHSKIHATDGAILLTLGGVARLGKSHALRYEGFVGFSRIAFADIANGTLFSMPGVKGGAGLGYEWVFYKADRIAWNTAISTEYTATNYNNGAIKLVIQEIMPKLGIGLEGREHHYFELFVGVPVFTKMTLQSSSHQPLVISQQPRHIRLGLVYVYRF